MFIALWLLVALVTRYSSAAALLASAVSPLVLLLLARHEAAVLCALLAAGLWFKHRANIDRLLHGTESRIGAGKRSDGESEQVA